jgi:hypothetical protein
MTQTKNIVGQFQRGPINGAGMIEAVEGNLRISAKMADWDRLGCLLDKLEIQPTHSSSLEIDPTDIERKLTYLGEILKVIEKEGNAGKTILRSAPPCIEEEIASFFEMIIDPHQGLTLVRYAYDRREGVRAPIPIPLTRSTLERLIKDLSSLASLN